MPNAANLRRPPWRRTFSLLVFVSCISFSPNAGEVNLRSGYVFDGLVTNNWYEELSAQYPVRDGLQLRGAVSYLDAKQDSLHGIKTLRAPMGSALAGLSWTSPGYYATVNLDAGTDYLWGVHAWPRGELKCSAGMPIPPNDFLRTPHVSAESWYRHWIVNAAAVKNRVASYGFAFDLMADMAAGLSLGGNFQREFLSPEHAVLDTSFMAAIGGVPFDTLHDNAINSFYAFLSEKIADAFQIGYALAWTNSQIDRWISTRYTPSRNTIPPTLFAEYAYYPYSTPRQSLAHLAIVSSTLAIGSKVRLDGKIAFPVYSRRTVYSSPAVVPSNAAFYYTQKFTGPLTISAKAQIHLSKALSCGIRYQYFCLPYTEWAYFTYNSYSYNDIAAVIGWNY
jgi:hypothetical protein